MKRIEAIEFLKSINKNLISCMNNSKKGNEDYRMYVCSKNTEEIENTELKLTNDSFFSLPLKAEIMRSRFSLPYDNPHNYYLAKFAFDGKKMDVKLFGEKEKEGIKCYLKKLAEDNHAEISFKEVERCKEHCGAAFERRFYIFDGLI